MKVRKFFENSRCEDLQEYFLEIEDEFDVNITYLSNFEGEIELYINFEISGPNFYHTVYLDRILSKLWERSQFIRNMGEFQISPNHRGNWVEIEILFPLENTYNVDQLAIGDRELSDFSNFLEKLRETPWDWDAIRGSVVEKITCYFVY